MKIFLVGGAVRDGLLGVKSKDLDYVMVLDNLNLSVEEGFETMEKYLKNEGFTIWLSTPDMFTIRAKFPEGHKFKGDADFVLARKELGYEPDSRRPKLVLGTLHDDLARRDFTVNAMAQDEDGNIIDPFNGKKDLKRKVLETPIPALLTFQDDPLRMIRGLRFAITKGFEMSPEVKRAMRNIDAMEKFKRVVSYERVREELFKMFKHDTKATLRFLIEADNTYFPGVLELCFGGGMWLEPTMKSVK